MRTGVRSWSRWARIPEQHSQDIRRVWLLLLGYALQMSTSEYPPMWMRLRGGSRTPGWAAGLDSSPATHTSPLFLKSPIATAQAYFLEPFLLSLFLIQATTYESTISISLKLTLCSFHSQRHRSKVYTFTPNTGEAREGRSLWVQDHSNIYEESSLLWDTWSETLQRYLNKSNGVIYFTSRRTVPTRAAGSSLDF